MKTRFVILLIGILVIVHPAAGFGQWQFDGVGICTFESGQYYPTLVSDGAGGAIVIWEDHREGIISVDANIDLYAQRISASGTPLWTGDGVALSLDPQNQVDPAIISDGVGGAIVAWEDQRTLRGIYAQRISASGVLQWAADGVTICGNAGYSPGIVADGAGGAIVTWQDYDIYAQRINASGIVQWPANGVALCTAAQDQIEPRVVSDGAGGAIVAWEDLRSRIGQEQNRDIYAQRIGASGVVQWTPGGVALCTAADWQTSLTMVSDGSGGAIATWTDDRVQINQGDIYSQRVDASGVVQWTLNGVALCATTDGQGRPSMASDGVGGAIVVWTNSFDGIHAQRISASGAAQWAECGVTLGAPGSYSTMTSDGAQGAIIVTWQMGAGGIYAQRISASGVRQWDTNGVALCTAAGAQEYPQIVSDGTGNAIVTWQDQRRGTNDESSKVYAQRVENHGVWGYPDPLLASITDVPEDQGGKVRVNWYASGRDELDQQFISHYSIWRAVDSVAVALSDAPRVRLSDIGPEFSGPAIRHEHTPTADAVWELLGTQVAVYQDAYSFTAATAFDSSGVNPAVHQFQVVAHENGNPSINWASNVVSGYSVDNLAAAPPLFLTAERVGENVHLEWRSAVAPDVRDYAIYRATSPGVAPVPGYFLTSSGTTQAVDIDAPSGPLFYVVTTFDTHGNQSAPSNEASIPASPAGGNTPSIAALTVLQNHPNPFTGTTDLRIGLPAASNISLEVYDVAGRRVRAELLARQNAGWRTVPIDGRDDRGRPLASGVYFYRVTASGTTVTHKMVIVR